MKECGYKEDTKYEPHESSPATRSKNQSPNIWYNSFNRKNVKTNVGKAFFKLKHFVRDHKFAEIINKNYIKDSYSRMDNKKKIVIA